MIQIDETTMQLVGENVKAGNIGTKLIIVVDTTVDLGPSSTGKMNGVASTGGFTGFPCGVKGNLYLGKKA